MAKSNEVRAYQILNHAGKMVGNRVAAKKIDAITAYEIVQRDSHFAYQIVEAVVKDGKILETETAQGGDLLTFDQCVSLIGAYKKFHAAPTKNGQTDETEGVVEKWNGVIEIHFEADSKIDADELYDMLYQMKERAKNAGDRGRVVFEVPKGLSLSNINLPDDAVYLPE